MLLIVGAMAAYVAALLLLFALCVAAAHGDRMATIGSAEERGR